ncbi:MAG: hypothetical protein AAFR52_18895 [Pseudomonadota bacterium]
MSPRASSPNPGNGPGNSPGNGPGNGTRKVTGSGGGSGGGTDTWLIAGALVVALLLLALLLRGGAERVLPRTPIGFDGLAAWLRTVDQPARTYQGWGRIDPAEVGLRILPLFDAELDVDRPRATTEEELILRDSEVDMRARILRSKLTRLPTLLVLHKWRTGTALTGIAHPLLVGSARRQTRLVERIDDTALGRVRILPEAMARIPVTGRDDLGEALLYLPQVLDLAEGADCAPLIGTRRAMVLGRCTLAPTEDGEPPGRFWLLTDPDLLNNHGLRLGDNAAIAAALLPDFADGGLAVIDYTTRIWVIERTRREREWRDLARFFAWPFTVLWLGLGAVLALAVWRGAVRYGAPLPGADTAPGAARTVSIAAKARLMRLAGEDGRLLDAYVTQRLATLADQLLGHRRPGGDPLQPLSDWLERRRVPGAPALAAAADAARALPADTPPATVARRLDDFEIALEGVLDDLGRPARHG